MSTPDRFDLMHEQYLEDWIEDNRRHQYEACGIEVPVEAEVQAILRAWENGSDQKPWLDAGSEVKLRLVHPASPGEDESEQEARGCIPHLPAIAPSKWTFGVVHLTGLLECQRPAGLSPNCDS